MGNGPSNTPAANKAAPGTAAAAPVTIVDDTRTTVVELAADSLGLGVDGLSPGGPIHYCERPRDLRVETLPGTELEFNQPIHLVLANPPLVADTAGKHIATLFDPQESAILRCLEDGWLLSGHITALDDYRRSGVIRVSGRPQPELG
jgi:hypothetical protein